MADGQTNAESELESFRKQWREEVSRRGQPHAPRPRLESGGNITTNSSGPGRPLQTSKQPPPSRTNHAGTALSHQDDLEPTTYHDLENKEDAFKLDAPAGSRQAALGSKPETALDHYEKAVERESAGKLGDSLSLYRKAFKLDNGVQEAYKQKHFPPSSFAGKPANVNPSNASPTVPNTAHHSLQGGTKESTDEVSKQSTLTELLDEFSTLSIEPVLPETDLSLQPPCPIASIPEELLTEILTILAVRDVASLSRVAQVCKRLAYLVSTEDAIWRRVIQGSEWGMPTQRYRYAVDLRGHPLFDDTPVLPHHIPDLTPSIYATYRAQFRHRPRLRFGGCYISTVNYSRPGASEQSRIAWSAPIHIVTYYRYLRFFRDGTAISLLTTAEPSDVVHVLHKDNLHSHHQPGSVMREALHGRWRLSGPAAGAPPSPSATDAKARPGEYALEPLAPDADTAPDEPEGTVHIETEGVVPKYMWKMEFGLGSAGRRDGVRGNKLSWRGFWSYNRLTDDWGEFGLKNDRPFYWSRVRSYGVG